MASNQFHINPRSLDCVPLLEDTWVTMPVVHEANVCATRSFVVPQNRASKKEGPVLTTSPEIYQAPNIPERSLAYDST